MMKVIDNNSITSATFGTRAIEMIEAIVIREIATLLRYTELDPTKMNKLEKLWNIIKGINLDKRSEYELYILKAGIQSANTDDPFYSKLRDALKDVPQIE